MQDSLNAFNEVAQRPQEAISRQRNLGQKKIVGCVPMHVPEEIIDAAGVLPITLQGYEGSLMRADTRIQPFFCVVGRTLVDQGLRGSFSSLDGIVIPDTCHTIRGLARISRLDFPLPFHQLLWLASNPDSASSKVRMLKEAQDMKSGIEKLSGRRVTDDSLRRSIGIYNQHRRLLRELYDLRRETPGLVKARDMAAVIASSMLMPKEEHNRLLTAYLDHLRRTPPPQSSAVRLMLSGSLCCPPDPNLLEIVENSGAVVVDDDLYFGSRYFAEDVNEDARPMEAIVDRYFRIATACPTRHNSKYDPAAGLIDKVGRSQAQGVISLLIHYCEPHSVMLPYVGMRLKEAGIPHLVLEAEPSIGAPGRLETRIQAFLETFA